MKRQQSNICKKGKVGCLQTEKDGKSIFLNLFSPYYYFLAFYGFIDRTASDMIGVVFLLSHM